MTTTRPHQPQFATAFPEDSPAMVLLVDDQMLVGEAVRRLLVGQPGIEFHYCANPARAVATAEEVKPTVILQDLVMPGIDGLDLVRQYRANSATRDVPIVVLSVKDEPTLKGEAFMAGANDYLVKLPDQIELLARIRYHSMAYLHRRQRDEAYRALQESQRQLMETNFELLQLTNTDALTGLSNRRYFDEYLEAEWKRAMRMKSPLSLLLIDIDYFKQFNDSYGHPAGDRALTDLADILTQHGGRSADLKARLGGDEFALVLPQTDLAGARMMAEELCGKVRSQRIPHRASPLAEHMSVTVGGASIVPSLKESALVLVDTADKALYEAKAAGRNCAIVRERDSPA